MSVLFLNKSNLKTNENVICSFHVSASASRTEAGTVGSLHAWGRALTGTRSPVATWSHITGKPKHFTANREDMIPSQSRDPQGSQFPEPILRLLRWVLGVHGGRPRAGLYWFLETPCPALCLLAGRPWRWAEAEWLSCRW